MNARNRRLDEYISPGSSKERGSLGAGSPASSSKMSAEQFREYLTSFILDPKKKQATVVETVSIQGRPIHKHINEYWTAKQRQASSVHEVSYRACFKPQLPAFFIKTLTEEGDVVYDPFSGRGTTVVEAALSGRRVIANDVNPLSAILSRPRISPPTLAQVRQRLEQIPFSRSKKAEMDLSMFYHADTEGELVSLREYLIERKSDGTEDDVDRWIRMVATNRLTGHSSGFFSVYSLPPNQAASPESQRRINIRLNQVPEYRDVRSIILKKSKQLLSEMGEKERERLRKVGESAMFLCGDARETDQIPSGLVQLTVTSPPFLDIVQYAQDNWLRCWFNNIDTEAVAERITMSRTVEEWSNVMSTVFEQLYRITRPGGWVAFEVGEVRKGTVKLDEFVVPIGVKAGFSCFGILINSQEFTKTSNIWGVNNNEGGTNTNRIVLFFKQ